MLPGIQTFGWVGKASFPGWAFSGTHGGRWKRWLYESSNCPLWLPDCMLCNVPGRHVPVLYLRVVGSQSLFSCSSRHYPLYPVCWTTWESASWKLQAKHSACLVVTSFVRLLYYHKSSSASCKTTGVEFREGCTKLLQQQHIPSHMPLPRLTGRTAADLNLLLKQMVSNWEDKINMG